MAPARYSLGAILLHWLIAAALAFQIVFAESLDGPRGPDLFARFQLHKSVGITILLLSMLRLGWRSIARRPAPVPGPKWAMTLSSIVHAGFYVVMIGAPLTGWIVVSSSTIRVDTLLFGAIPWPHLPVPAWLGEPSETIHEVLPKVGVGLFFLHVAGALRHQYLLGTPILARMLPGGKGKAAGAVLLAASIMLAGLASGKVADPKGKVAAPARAEPVDLSETEPTLPQPPAPDADKPIEDDAAPANTTEDEDASPEPRNWSVAPGGSLGFTARWNGEPVTGTFSRWSADIQFDPQALDRSIIDISIDLASVDTGDSQRDGTLADVDFFDTSRFARANYRATRFRALGANRFRADGTLMLRGVSRPVSVTFTLDIDGNRARARGSATIDRTSFGVGQGDHAATSEIAGPVAVNFAFRATTPN